MVESRISISAASLFMRIWQMTTLLWIDSWDRFKPFENFTHSIEIYMQVNNFKKDL